MSRPVRCLVAGGLLVVLGSCSDTAPTAPATEGGAAPPRISAAGKPTRSPVPFNPIEFPAGEFCSFPVLLDFPVNQYMATTFPPQPNGDVVEIQTGKVVGRFTNLSTGKTITYNISGPTRFTFHADGSVTLELPGPQGIFNSINWGRIVLEFSPDGELTSFIVTGHSEDICPALA
jgi:hypothetical protein